MEEGEHAHDDVVVREPRHRSERLVHVGDEVVVREHHALGEAGGAARVGQDHEVFAGVDRHVGHRPVLFQERGEGSGARGLPEDEHLLDARAAGGLSRLVEERGDGQEEAGATVRELVLQLLDGVRRVDRGDDPAHQRNRVEGDRVLGAVGAVDRENVAFLETAGGEPERTALHGTRPVAVGQDAAGRPVDEGGFFGPLRRGLQEQGSERNFRDRHVGERAAEDHGQERYPSAGGRSRTHRRVDLDDVFFEEAELAPGEAPG